MDKHEKAQVVKAITLLQAGRCRHEEAMEILYGLVGLVYPSTRLMNNSPPDHLPQDDPGPSEEEAAANLARLQLNTAQRAELGLKQLEVEQEKTREKATTDEVPHA